MLVFGAATDYALLLIARYREELRRVPDRFAAMRSALRRTAEPVVASGSTVVLGVLALLLSEQEPNRALAVACATGVVLAMVSALVVLPAALLRSGRGCSGRIAPGDRRGCVGRSASRPQGDRTEPAALAGLPRLGLEDLSRRYLRRGNLRIGEPATRAG